MTKKPAVRTRHDRRAERAESVAANPAGATGDGLATLIAETPDASAEVYCPTLHAAIRPDPDNPRKLFEAEGLAELAASIGRDGLLEPLVIRPLAVEPGAFMLIAGERRWRAIGQAIAAGAWPADKPIPAMLRDVSERDARRLALVENLQRSDLKPIEEARALQALAELEGKSAAQIGRDLGYSEKWAQQRLQLLKLPAALQARVDAGDLKLEDARYVPSLLEKLPPIQAVALREGKTSVAEAKAWLASRPQALELEPDDALALLEVAWAITAQNKSAGRYTDAPVDYRYRKAPLFEGSALWTVNRSYADGRDRIVVGFGGWAHLRAITGSDEPLRRELLEAHLRKARVAALPEANPLHPEYDPQAFKKVDALFREKRFLTFWLNKPFEVDPQWKAQRAEQEAQHRAEAEKWQCERAAADAEREREQAEARAKLEAEKAAGGEFLQRVLQMDGDASALGVLLADQGFTGPFTVDVVGEDHRQVPAIVDATGKEWMGHGDQLEALRRVMAIGLNVALGLPATSGPPIEDAPWRREAAAALAAQAALATQDATDDERMTRAEFERAIAGCLMDDLEIGDVEAARMAAAGVAAQLLREEAGEDVIAWEFDGAMDLAEKIRVDGLGQQIDLEEAIAVAETPAAEPALSPALLALAGVPAAAAQ